MADWEAPYRAGLTPASKPINAQITIPGSKSATNRALILAAIASTPSRLRKPLTSRDTDLMVKGLKNLGVKIEKIDTNDGFDYIIKQISKGIKQNTIMAIRFSTTVYNEKSRKITVSIKDSAFSGTVKTFDTLSLGIQYDSESQQGQERFTPIIGSRCSLSLLINNEDLQTLLLDIGLAVEGRFTMELIAYEDDNTTVSFKWYGYIVTDLVEFEDVPLVIGYQAQISAIDGLGWLKTLDYKSAVGPYNGQDTVHKGKDPWGNTISTFSKPYKPLKWITLKTEHG